MTRCAYIYIHMDSQSYTQCRKDGTKEIRKGGRTDCRKDGKKEGRMKGMKDGRKE